MGSTLHFLNNYSLQLDASTCFAGAFPLDSDLFGWTDLDQNGSLSKLCAIFQFFFFVSN